MRRIAIIGGGPGGAHCARRLVESGFEVTLFEPRARFEKPCGGGIPARGIETFPFLADPRLPARTLKRCLIIAPSGATAEVPLREPLYVYRRADLHEFLLDRAVAAGTRMLVARAVAFGPAAAAGDQPGAGPQTGSASSAPPWTVVAMAAAGERETHGPFDFLIAADGASGFARRKLTGGIPSAELTQAIGYYLPGVVEEAIVLKFCAGLDGYAWVFPRVDHDAAGICGTLGSLPVSHLRHLLDGFLRERYGGERLERVREYAALIPGAPSDSERHRLHGPGWALAGDTSQSVDPLTREGIYYAMQSGEILAAALAARKPESYPRLWRRTMGGEFAWAGRHAADFFDARFIERAVALCSRSPRTSVIMSDLIAGHQRYRGLALRLALNSPVIAWQVVRSARPPGDHARSWQLKH